jgi:hypothetical protein
MPVTIAGRVPGQQGVTLQAVHRHKGCQQGGRHAYAGVLRPDVSQEEVVAGAGLRAARDRAAVRGHPGERGRQGGRKAGRGNGGEDGATGQGHRRAREAGGEGGKGRGKGDGRQGRQDFDGDTEVSG